MCETKTYDLQSGDLRGTLRCSVNEADGRYHMLALIEACGRRVAYANRWFRSKEDAEAHAQRVARTALAHQEYLVDALVRGPEKTAKAS